jgi:hypothetical protein
LEYGRGIVKNTVDTSKLLCGLDEYTNDSSLENSALEQLSIAGSQ